MASPICQITDAKVELRYLPESGRVIVRWYHPGQADDLLSIDSPVESFLNLAAAVTEMRIRIEQMAAGDG